ncbi:MAG: hypothetical protein R2724_22615 [Bryobacterales bacterium]
MLRRSVSLSPPDPIGAAVREYYHRRPGWGAAITLRLRRRILSGQHRPANGSHAYNALGQGIDIASGQDGFDLGDFAIDVGLSTVFGAIPDRQGRQGRREGGQPRGWRRAEAIRQTAGSRARSASCCAAATCKSFQTAKKLKLGKPATALRIPRASSKHLEPNIYGETRDACSSARKPSSTP